MSAPGRPVETRNDMVELLRKLACEAVAGQTRPTFRCKTPAKADAVLAYAFAVLADLIEKGEPFLLSDLDAARND